MNRGWFKTFQDQKNERYGHLEADPDPDPTSHHEIMRICDFWSTDLNGDILSVNVSIVSVLDPPLFNFEHPQLLIFNLMRIRILL
jgi:hypothetical protein